MPSAQPRTNPGSLRRLHALLRLLGPSPALPTLLPSRKKGAGGILPAGAGGGSTGQCPPRSLPAEEAQPPSPIPGWRRRRVPGRVGVRDLLGDVGAGKSGEQDGTEDGGAGDQRVRDGVDVNGLSAGMMDGTGKRAPVPEPPAGKRCPESHGGLRQTGPAVGCRGSPGAVPPWSRTPGTLQFSPQLRCYRSAHPTPARYRSVTGIPKNPQHPPTHLSAPTAAGGCSGAGAALVAAGTEAVAVLGSRERPTPLRRRGHSPPPLPPPLPPPVPAPPLGPGGLLGEAGGGAPDPAPGLLRRGAGNSPPHSERLNRGCWVPPSLLHPAPARQDLACHQLDPPSIGWTPTGCTPIKASPKATSCTLHTSTGPQKPPAGPNTRQAAGPQELLARPSYYRLDPENFHLGPMNHQPDPTAVSQPPMESLQPDLKRFQPVLAQLGWALSLLLGEHINLRPPIPFGCCWSVSSALLGWLPGESQAPGDNEAQPQLPSGEGLGARLRAPCPGNCLPLAGGLIPDGAQARTGLSRGPPAPGAAALRGLANLSTHSWHRGRFRRGPGPRSGLPGQPPTPGCSPPLPTQISRDQPRVRRLRGAAAQGKGAGPPRRRLTEPPPSCFSAAEPLSSCSGRPPSPSFPLPTDRATGSAGTGRRRRRRKRRSRRRPPR
ncbi:basic proline-rich protein-like [Indicator indicator]|uniref:basic proline-rich protein-like n=1 Tax=Indicator indicator TaxID=1002788 RepID=UPI0023DFDE8E|nr:basic proline-rich protein-like [Indicator indicator]